MNIPKLKPKHLKALRDAIDEAQVWHGSLTPEQWPAFDKRIALMREALKIVKDFHNKKHQAAIICIGPGE